MATRTTSARVLEGLGELLDDVEALYKDVHSHPDIVLRGGLYVIPALLGATIVVVAYREGNYSTVFPILAAAVCFAIRMAGLRYDLNLPAASDVPETLSPRRLRRRERGSD